MAASTEGPRQFKQPSRKGKRAWRKNVDLTDVQEGLETVRDEVIQGGVIAEKSSSELFTIDATGDVVIQKAYRRPHRPLKADEILAQRSAVPAVDSRKRPASRTTDGVLEPSSKKRRSGGVSHKELERLKGIAYGGEKVHKDIVKEPAAPDYDPWAEDPVVKFGDKDPMFSFLEPPKPINAPETLKHGPISLAATGKDIPAVRVPEAEVSYNPQSTAYFDAFTRAGQAEAKAEQKRLRAAEEEQRRQEKIALAAADSEHEASEDEDDESAWEGLDSEHESTEWLSRRRPERKTQAQRNKIKRRKESERQARAEAQARRRARQADEIRKIAKEVEAKGRSGSLRDASPESEDEPGDDGALRRRRLGKALVPEPPLEMVLPSELQESLRLLKPEGNLLKDRFRSLLVRGKVETRKPITQAKKARRKATEKWSYKDWKLK